MTSLVTGLEDNTSRGSGDVLGDRLTVGQVPLEHFVQVRILVAQPKVDARCEEQLGFFGGNNVPQELNEFGFHGSRMKSNG